jgi:hypothetical protein
MKAQRVPRPTVVLGFGAVFAISLAAGVLRSAPALEDGARARQFFGSVAVAGISSTQVGSLTDLVKASDLVVVGRIAAVEKGREWLADPSLRGTGKEAEAMARFATLSIDVEDTVVGAASGSQVKMEIFLPKADSLGKLKASIPRGRALFFLHEKREPGVSGIYRFVTDAESFYLDVDGTVQAPAGDDSAVAASLTGQPFIALVAQTRARVAQMRVIRANAPR